MTQRVTEVLSRATVAQACITCFVVDPDLAQQLPAAAAQSDYVRLLRMRGFRFVILRSWIRGDHGRTWTGFEVAFHRHFLQAGPGALSSVGIGATAEGPDLARAIREAALKTLCIHEWALKREDLFS